jgi:hypothetical protein
MSEVTQPNPEPVEARQAQPEAMGVATPAATPSLPAGESEEETFIEPNPEEVKRLVDWCKNYLEDGMEVEIEYWWKSKEGGSERYVIRADGWVRYVAFIRPGLHKLFDEVIWRLAEDYAIRITSDFLHTTYNFVSISKWRGKKNE